MAKRKFADELTEDELHDRLMDKKILGRAARIASYRANGRAVDPENAPIYREMTETRDERGEPVRAKTAPRRKFDRFLLTVEVLSVIAVIWLLGSGIHTLNRINRESGEKMMLPTLTPTAIIQAVVLPGGHTPPDTDGTAAFNEAEIPAHLRSLIVANAAKEISLPPGREQIIRARIPAINVDAPVFWGDDWETLKKGIGQNVISVEPGSNGNLILSAHNDIFGQVFRDLDRLKPGDEIVLLTEKKSYTYIVRDSKIVEPNQVEVMNQTQDATVTLISCYPYLIDNKRIVITGKYY